MADFVCPECGGGFDEPHGGYNTSCPWCGHQSEKKLQKT